MWQNLHWYQERIATDWFSVHYNLWFNQSSASSAGLDCVTACDCSKTASIHRCLFMVCLKTARKKTWCGLLKLKEVWGTFTPFALNQWAAPRSGLSIKKPCDWAGLKSKWMDPGSPKPTHSCMAAMTRPMSWLRHALILIFGTVGTGSVTAAVFLHAWTQPGAFYLCC